MVFHGLLVELVALLGHRLVLADGGVFELVDELRDLVAVGCAEIGRGFGELGEEGVDLCERCGHVGGM